MLDAFIRSYSLVRRGGPGLACDAEGLALGPVRLAKANFDSAGGRRCRLLPPDDVIAALQLAYGPIPDQVTKRWCRGLVKVAELLAGGEDARARIYAVLLGLPEIPPEGMAKLAHARALQKYNPDWESESRVPSKNPGGGQWTTGDGEVQVAIRCQGIRNGCQSGGSYGMTGMYRIGGKILCRNCAIKELGAEGEPGPEQTRTLEPYIFDPSN